MGTGAGYPTQLQNILNRLDGVQPSGNGWMARCPAHDDQHPSLSIGSGENGQVLLHCFTGCQPEQIVEKIGLKMRDLFPLITLGDLAVDKGLPVEFLQATGIGFSNLDDGGIGIPYRDADGHVVLVKRRTALKAKDGSFWPKGKKLMAYGLWRLTEAKKIKRLMLVEGESDAWTLWHHDHPAIGIPGAQAAGVLQADVFEGVDEIFVWQEPDQGGQIFASDVPERLRELGFKGAIKIIRVAGVKDPNELHKRDPRVYILNRHV